MQISKILLIFLLLFTSSSAQINFFSPGTVRSIGLGNQSVAADNSEDASIYNPSNLAYAKQYSFSFFREASVFPFSQMPRRKFSLTIPKGKSAFQLQYSDLDLGKVAYYRSSEWPVSPEVRRCVFKDIGLGFGTNLSPDLMLGAYFKYIFGLDAMHLSNHFIISAGLNYRPSELDKRLAVGFSLTNFGPALENTSDGSTYAPPSRLNLGATYKVLQNNFLNASIHVTAEKQFNQSNRFNDAKSSLYAFMIDWKDFPRDVNLHTGLEFSWQPLSLGAGFSFYERFTIGNIGYGTKNYMLDLYTQAVEMGFGYRGISLELGFGSYWHRVQMPGNYLNALNYYGYSFGRSRFSECFQLKMGVSPEFFGGTALTAPNENSNSMKKIILSAGVGYNLLLGKNSEFTFNPLLKYSRDNSTEISIEAGFYFNPSEALITQIGISKGKRKWEYTPNGFPLIENSMEYVTLATGYRLHPWAVFEQFYLQGLVGMERAISVTGFSNPRYFYSPFTRMGTGCLFQVLDKISLSASVELTTVFHPEGSALPRLGGFNQLDFSIKTGYCF